MIVDTTCSFALIKTQGLEHLVKVKEVSNVIKQGEVIDRDEKWTREIEREGSG